jgi:hypothetical protein
MLFTGKIFDHPSKYAKPATKAIAAIEIKRFIK